MLKALIVDPSLFTLPYDEALVTALIGSDIDATLVGRQARAGEPEPTVPFIRHFYRLSDNAPRRFGTVGAGVKALEHCADVLRLSTRGSKDPVVFHAQWLPFPLMDRLAIKVWRRRGPVVVTVHDTTPFNGNPTSRFQAQGFIAALAEADRLIVHTESGVERLVEGGLDRTRIHRIPHGPLGGPPRASAAPTPGGAGAGPKRSRIVVFGKMRPYKGIDILLDSLAHLDPAERAALDVVIAGEPLMNIQPFEAQIRTHGMEECVTLIPRRFDDDEIAALLASADAFVFPYREIEASGVLFMVQGLGRWIVASSLGAFAEAIEDGQSGRLVPAGDVASLANALREIASSRPFPARPLRVTGWPEIARATGAVYGNARKQWSVSTARP